MKKGTKAAFFETTSPINNAAPASTNASATIPQKVKPSAFLTADGFTVAPSDNAERSNTPSMDSLLH